MLHFLFKEYPVSSYPEKRNKERKDRPSDA